MLNPEIAVNRRFVDRLSRNARLGALAERVQERVVKLLAATGRPVQNVLHGTLLGHPLHAVITDIPIGAWTVTAIFDALEVAGAPPVAGSDAALGIGLGGGALAALSGWADWSDTAGDPRALGLAHALTNGIAFSAYAVAFVLRRGERRRLGLALSLVAYAVVGAGAYLGGELSFGQSLGVRHTAIPIVPSDDFTPVLDAATLSDDRPARADFNGIPILVSRTADGVAAISAVCTHRGAPLDEGTFADGCVICPWHGSRFALADGRVLDGPATFEQPRFEARVNGERVEVRALTV